MANEKIKKVIFTLICVVLLSSMVLVAYAVWDDVAGKKTNEMKVTTGNNSVLSCSQPTATAATDGKKLAPDDTKNYGGSSTAANSSYYLAWSMTPTLTNVREMEIILDTLTVTFSNSAGTAVENPQNILTWWIQDSAPVATDGKVTKPASTLVVNSKLESGKTYYFVIKFTNGISDTTALYKNHNINVNLAMSASIKAAS